MDAKRCDQCGEFYQDLREPAATITVDVFKEDRTRQPIKIHASFLPMSADGQGRDLCRECRHRAVEAVLHHVAGERFGLELNQKGQNLAFQVENSRLEKNVEELKLEAYRVGQETSDEIANLQKALASEQERSATLTKSLQTRCDELSHFQRKAEEFEAALKAAKEGAKK